METDEWGEELKERVGGMETVTAVSGYFIHCLALACTQSRSHDPHTRNMTARP